MAATPPPGQGTPTSSGSLFDEDGGFFDIDIGPEVPILGSLLHPGPDAEEQEGEEQEGALRRHGLPTRTRLQSSTANLESQLAAANVDVENAAVQAMLQDPAIQELLRGPLAAAMVTELATQYPAIPAQEYDAALQLSGFRGDFNLIQDPADLVTLTAGTDTQIARFRETKPSVETHPDTGWLRFANGVLVSPEGQVVFDPTSRAPGSLTWQREVVPNWSAEKVSEWRERLHKLGYLTKDQAKVDGVDTPFLNALRSFHENRYVNGGKPVAGDLAGVAGAGAADKPPLLDFDDMQAQIRNDVREQYRRVFGEDPSDGEVAAFSASIIRTAETLQRRYRRKEYGGFTSMAATEAEERFIERLEQSPEAEFLRDSEEENTSLRDAIQQAVIVTNSLGG